jgi:hypothetical protein
LDTRRRKNKNEKKIRNKQKDLYTRREAKMNEKKEKKEWDEKREKKEVLTLS